MGTSGAVETSWSAAKSEAYERGREGGTTHADALRRGAVHIALQWRCRSGKGRKALSIISPPRPNDRQTDPELERALRGEREMRTTQLRKFRSCVARAPLYP